MSKLYLIVPFVTMLQTGDFSSKMALRSFAIIDLDLNLLIDGIQTIVTFSLRSNGSPRALSLIGD